MSALLAFAALSVVTLAWLALPLLPAFQELRGHDVDPLPIPADHDGDARHFAKRFRQYVESDSRRPTLGPAAERVVTDGHPLRVFVAAAPLLIDRDWVSPGDIYGARSVRGEDGITLRGLLAEGDIVLGDASEVRRWIHGAGSVDIGPFSRLHGRASAERSLRVGDATTFEWLSAPNILFGNVESTDASAREVGRPAKLTTPPRRITGDYAVPAHSIVDEALIVKGTLRVGDHSVVNASLKSHGTLHLGDGVCVRGNVVSRTSIIAGSDCTITGVVVAEGSVRFGTRACVGSRHTPATVSAPIISIAPGSVAHGTVWARSRGIVSARGTALACAEDAG